MVWFVSLPSDVVPHCCFCWLVTAQIHDRENVELTNSKTCGLIWLCWQKINHYRTTILCDFSPSHPFQICSSLFGHLESFNAKFMVCGWGPFHHWTVCFRILLFGFPDASNVQWTSLPGIAAKLGDNAAEKHWNESLTSWFLVALITVDVGYFWKWWLMVVFVICCVFILNALFGLVDMFFQHFFGLARPIKTQWAI